MTLRQRLARWIDPTPCPHCSGRLDMIAAYIDHMDALANVDMQPSLASRRLMAEIERSNNNVRELSVRPTPFTRAKQRRERP